MYTYTQRFQNNILFFQPVLMYTPLMLRIQTTTNPRPTVNNLYSPYRQCEKKLFRQVSRKVGVRFSRGNECEPTQEYRKKNYNFENCVYVYFIYISGILTVLKL